MTSDALIRLAFADLAPGKTTEAVRRAGAAAALAEVEKTATTYRRERLAVPSSQRLSELRLLEADLVMLDETGYPPRLAGIAEPPLGLYVRGSLPPVPLVAVVGTRRCSSYGSSLAHEYGASIAEAGWGVVSGLARGIDGAAHRGTIGANGVGVAVLGSGIDVIYPREHRGLAEALIAGGGALCTEYPPGTRPDGWRFPPRNRIIVGMSAAVVVVEAAIKGGALITATIAMETGVPVFAVPGDVGRSAAEGTNRLIRDGAHPVLEPEDLIEELSLVLGPPARLTRAVRIGVAASVPAGGITIDALASLLGSDVAVVAAEVVTAEMTGSLRVEGDLVFRG